MFEYLVLCALVAVIILLVLDRYFDKEQHGKEIKHLLEENSRMVKAVMAKNATEYVMTTGIDKVPNDAKPAIEENPEQDIASLSDSEFDSFIDKQNGKVSKDK